LFEIRGVGIGRTSFKRRVYTGYLIAKAYAFTAARDKDKLRAVLQEAQSQATPAVVTSASKKELRDLQFIDLSTRKEITDKVTVLDALQSTPKIVRPRPFAYLIPASQKRVVQNLRLLGLVLDSLPAAKTIAVEQFAAKSATQDDPEDGEDEPEGGQPKATMQQKEKDFAAGTYILYMQQPKSNLAIEVLEPEAENGFLANELINLLPDGSYPVYRYMATTKLN
jgi:hypothetical protein